MEEEIVNSLNRQTKVSVQNTWNSSQKIPGSHPIATSIGTKLTSGYNHDAKRMSLDETMNHAHRQQRSGSIGSSPISSFLSRSPQSAWNNGGGGVPAIISTTTMSPNNPGAPTMGAQGRRESLKNLWHLQDFGSN